MLLIARRYLLSAKSHSVVNIIAWVSILSLLLPVAAVIVLLSIFNGFGQLISQVERGLDGDLTLRLVDGKFFAMSDVDKERIEAVEGVRTLSFVTEQTLLVEHQGQSAVVTMRGVDDNFPEAVEIDSAILYGEFSLDEEAVVLGHSLALRLGVRSIQDIEIELHALKMGRLSSLIPTGQHATSHGTLRGTFQLDQESEERYAFTSQEALNALIGREGVASRIAVAIADEADIERVRTDIKRVVGEEFRVERREELNAAIHQIIRYEKMGVLLICSFVMILASFSLLGALTMLILEKRGDVATLRAMGMSWRGVERIFSTEGLLISGVACGVGGVLGIALTLLQQHLSLITLPSSSMATTPYPVELHAGDVVVVVAIAAAISLIVTQVVVKRAFRHRDSTNI